MNFLQSLTLTGILSLVAASADAKTIGLGFQSDLPVVWFGSHAPGGYLGATGAVYLDHLALRLGLGIDGAASVPMAGTTAAFSLEGNNGLFCKGPGEHPLTIDPVLGTNVIYSAHYIRLADTGAPSGKQFELFHVADSAVDWHGFAGVRISKAAAKGLFSLTVGGKRRIGLHSQNARLEEHRNCYAFDGCTKQEKSAWSDAGGSWPHPEWSYFANVAWEWLW